MPENIDARAGCRPAEPAEQDQARKQRGEHAHPWHAEILAEIFHDPNAGEDAQRTEHGGGCAERTERLGIGDGGGDRVADRPGEQDHRPTFPRAEGFRDQHAEDRAAGEVAEDVPAIAMEEKRGEGPPPLAVRDETDAG